MDYTKRPDVPPLLLDQVTNTLAMWLPSRQTAASLAAWDEDAWRAAEWIVYWQNALPWFVQRLRETRAQVPEAVWGRLAANDEASRERTRLMLDGVVELLSALEAKGVPALPFKGAALAPRYYPDPTIRPMGDLDILIRPEDLDTGVETLRDLGYRFFSRSAEDEVYLRGERKSNVWAPDNVHPVELHYALREEYAGLAYDLSGLMWASATVQPYWDGAETLLPDAATLFHHVCAHATSDWLIQRGRLMHLDDVRKMANGMSQEDWDALRRQVQPYGARFVYPIMAFAVRYAAAPIPAELLAELAAETPTALQAWVARTDLADTSISNPTSRSGLGLDMARMLARSPWERGSMWLRSIFPRRWNLVKRYPRLSAGPAWPVCYLLLNADRAKQLTLKALGRAPEETV